MQAVVRELTPYSLRSVKAGIVEDRTKIVGRHGDRCRRRRSERF